jgi:uncharacterized protein
MSSDLRILSGEDFERYSKMSELELKQRMSIGISADKRAWFEASQAIIAGVEYEGNSLKDQPALWGLVEEISHRVFGYDAGCRKLIAHWAATVERRAEEEQVADSKGPKPWFASYSGQQIYPLHPVLTWICIEDIAHALGNLCAHQGHTGWFFSVAQHSVILSEICPAPMALAALLRQGALAYLAELPVPRDGPSWPQQWLKLRKSWDEAIAAEFEIADPWPKDLAELDISLSHWELRQLFVTLPTGTPNHIVYPSVSALGTIKPLLPEDAEQLFLARFHQLNGTEPEAATDVEEGARHE